MIDIDMFFDLLTRMMIIKAWLPYQHTISDADEFLDTGRVK